MADLVSRRSTCALRSVGAIITTADYRVLATGYNGSPTGAPHCTEVGCALDNEGRCVRSIHAEINALLQVLGRSDSLVGARLYSTWRPCRNCFPPILQAGIRYVAFLEGDMLSLLTAVRRFGLEGEVTLSAQRLEG